MNRSDEINELAGALAKAQGEMGTAQLNTTNRFLKTKYANLASVMAASQKALKNNGLSVMQPCETLDDGDVVVTTILAHESGQWISSALRFTPAQEKGLSATQVMGKGISYLRRYGYSSVVGVAVGDDDDGHDAGVQRQQAPRAAAPKVPAPHWSTNDAERVKFWAWSTGKGANDQGLTNDQVHAALGVEHLVDFPGNIPDAVTLVRAFKKQLVAQQPALPADGEGR
jgi:hypothetical protein